MRLALLLCVALVAALSQSSSALALGQRGHLFSFRFGSFSDPAGIAVNDTSGDVYVSDDKRKRVDEFEPVTSGGELVGETESKLWEVDTIASPEAVAVDNSGEGTDPSAGDIYVVSNEKTIYKLNLEGKQIEVLKTPGGEASAKKFASIKGVAVNRAGDLFVYQEDGKIYKFSNALANIEIGEVLAPPEAEGFRAGKPGFAVDSEENFYIGDEGQAGDSSLQEGLLQEAKSEYEDQAEAAGEPPSFAVIAKLGGAGDEILLPALDYEFADAVAVNPLAETANQVDERDDAYVVNVSGAGAERTSTVAQFGPGSAGEVGAVIQRFTAPELRDGDAIAVDAKTGAVYVADAAQTSDDVDVFQLEATGPPVVADLASASSTGAEVLSANVDPSGASTDYYFEYGTSPCSASGCTATAPVNIGEGFADSVAGLELTGLQPGIYYYRVVAQNQAGNVQSRERTFAVVDSVTGLPDGRGWELVSPPNKDGAEPEALTREGGAIEASENGDAITYVADGPMPADGEAEGNRAPEYAQIFSTRGAQGWASKDITTQVTEGTGVEVGAPPEYQLFSPNLALSLVQPATGPPESGSMADPPFAPSETAQKTLYLRDDQPLDSSEEFEPLRPDEAESASYEAAEKNGRTATAPGYIALVTEIPGEASTEFGGGQKEGVEFVNATPNLSDVVVKSWKEAPGLYEWVGHEQPLKAVSILPGETTVVAPSHAFLGGPEGVNSRDAISANGARVVWTSQGAQGLDLFVRDTLGKGETLELDTPQGVGTTEETPDAIYQTANASGSKVFFTDTVRLTPNSRATAVSPNLYVAELQGGESEGEALEATLTDLTPEEGAKVQSNQYEGGGVLGAGEEADGELNVYFVADGALAPGSSPGYCSRTSQQERPAGTNCNLFVEHYNGSEWEAARLVAALSSEDQPDWWSDGLDDDLADLTSRVSPNGRYVAFMSDRSLTGYDNEDASSVNTKGARFDEEVYLYDAATGATTCVSCNPSGERPTGVLATKGAGEGIGLLVTRPTTWEEQGVDHWLAGSLPGWTAISAKAALYQSRYLSNEGRLFFNSADALVPLAKSTREEQIGGEEQEVGVENVYEYEPAGVGACSGSAGCVGLISSGTSERESAFLDASENGTDVFFLTAEPLTSQDTDANFDIYDAHVCEASSPCVTPAVVTETPCEEKGGEYCQAYEEAPSFATPASAALPGSGNLLQRIQVLASKEEVKAKAKPLTRTQKLAKALKACRTKYKSKKKKRIACEKLARKKYGPVKKKTDAKKSSEENGK
jgi:hypothetical protein